MVYSVAESGSEVRLSVSVLSGDIKRHSSVLVSTKSGTALGNIRVAVSSEIFIL